MIVGGIITFTSCDSALNTNISEIKSVSLKNYKSINIFIPCFVNQ